VAKRRTQVNVSVDASDAKNLVDSMVDNMRSYQVPLREANSFLKEEFGKNFDSEGAMVGGWAPLSPRTQAWRAKNGFPVPGPILVNDGSLRAAVANLKARAGDKEATYAVEHRLAPFHQYGSRKTNLPRREIVFEPPGFARLMGRRIAGHILPNAMTAELRRLFSP
jgi:phage gpG-like protein